MLQLLLGQAPLFWLAVAAFFFALGLLWANVCWSSYRVRLIKAESEQLFLVAEREEVFAARERRLRASAPKAAEVEPRIIRFDETLAASKPKPNPTSAERSSS